MSSNHQPPASFAEEAQKILEPARSVGFPVDSVVAALTALHRAECERIIDIKKLPDGVDATCLKLTIAEQRRRLEGEK